MFKMQQYSPPLHQLRYRRLVIMLEYYVYEIQLILCLDSWHGLRRLLGIASL